MEDLINQPPHYTACRPQVEPIDLTECLDFSLGNFFKYLSRAGLKDGNSKEQDLKKAIYYLRREISFFSEQYGTATFSFIISDRGLSYLFWVFSQHPYLKSYFRITDGLSGSWELEWEDTQLLELIELLEQRLNTSPKEAEGE